MDFMSFYNKILAHNEKLIRGAQLCDIGMIKEAINSGADINYRNAKAINSALQYYDQRYAQSSDISIVPAIKSRA
jgi:hypothetical protein